jgi:hypothetical protein
LNYPDVTSPISSTIIAINTMNNTMNNSSTTSSISIPRINSTDDMFRSGGGSDQQPKPLFKPASNGAAAAASSSLMSLFSNDIDDVNTAADNSAASSASVKEEPAAASVVSGATSRLPTTYHSATPPISQQNRKKLAAPRPSLSEQLATIGAQAESITADIRQKNKMDNGPTAAGDRSLSMDSALFTMPAKGFTIGTLNCRYPSPIAFYADRVEYQFNHPFESLVVNMIIYYRDMTAVTIIGNKFRFKLPKKLVMFIEDVRLSSDYHHMVTVELPSIGSAVILRERIIPVMRRY